MKTESEYELKIKAIIKNVLLLPIHLFIGYLNTS